MIVLRKKLNRFGKFQENQKIRLVQLGRMNARTDEMRESRRRGNKQWKHKPRRPQCAVHSAQCTVHSAQCQTKNKLIIPIINCHLTEARLESAKTD